MIPPGGDPALMGDGAGALERITAEWEIERLIRRFALLSDENDAEGLAQLFTTDGVFVRPGGSGEAVRGRDAIAAHFRDRPRRISRHLVANTVVDLDSPTTARAQSYVLLYTAPIGPTPAVADPVRLVGGYADRLVKEYGTWLFAERLGSVALKTALVSA